ncbi:MULTISPECIES: DUF4134 family protein [Sphingobacterium]|uniref:DUF4134 family protein n=1 Tax=Sphingobacterium TaxID=28453 RepID=UPI0025798E3F|nr:MULTISPECIES: DUF4134 family protein [Sphingobacterium]
MRNKMLKKINKPTFASIVAFILSITLASAQGDFGDGIAQGTAQITGNLDIITDLVMAIGGVVGIIGGVRIYQKWNNGDQDINKELMSFGGSALFLILAPIAIRAMFGL